MQIGYFVLKFPYDHWMKNYLYGGSSLAAYYLAFEMAKKDHEIDVFTTSVDSRDSVNKHENMTIYRYCTNFRLLSSNISFGLFYKPMRHDVNIIHTHFDNPPGPLAGLRYAKKKKVSLVVTYHGDWVERYGGFIRRIGVGFHNKYLVDKVLSFADVIISPSEYFIEDSHFLGKYRDKTVVIPNGVNFGEFNINYSKEECRKKLGFPLDKKILLFVGHLNPLKGPDVLVKSMPKIVKKIPNVDLVFAGKGVMKDELEILSKKLGLTKNVKFVGFVEDVFKKALYYKAADVFVFPSLSECLPLVVLEAMASGLPIITSRVGGIPDVVHNGENGLLIPPKDSDALTNAVLFLLENEDVRKRMGTMAKEKAEDYSWEQIAEKTENVYNEVIA